MGRALKATVDTKALKHNLNCVKQKVRPAKIIAMIKANGYGHGLVQVAETLKEADAFGVACIEEALILRQAGIQNRIVLLEGFFTKEELSDIVKFQLEPVIHHQAQLLDLLEREKEAKKEAKQDGQPSIQPLNIWVKIDTGMHRLGFQIEEWQKTYAMLQDLKTINIQGIMTHFASADEIHNPKTQKQMLSFQEALKNVGAIGSFPKSLANSAGIWAWPESHGDWVRPGIILYGVSPFANQIGADLGLMPVMTLSTSLIAIHWLKKGEQIGYGGIYTCEEEMPIGVVAVGYADGYPRHAPKGTPVLLNGKRVPVVGRVSMDMMTVDLRTVPDAKVGDPIELWGSRLPIEEVAQHMGTIGYELLTSLSPRVPLILN